MVGDGGGDVGGVVDIVEWFMYRSLYGEVFWFALIAIFCVDEKEEE